MCATRRQTIFFDERAPSSGATTKKGRAAPKSQARSKKDAKAPKKDDGDKVDAPTKDTTPRVIVNKSRELLLARMQKKQSETSEHAGDEHDELAQSGGHASIKDIVSGGSEIDTVKLASVFKAELTEVEQDIIKKRVAQQQRQFELYRKREINKKYAKIRQVYHHVTEQEVEFALQECHDDENEVITKLTKPGFLQSLRKKVAFQLQGKPIPEDKDEEGEEEEGGGFSKPRKQRRRKSSDEDESGEKDKVVKRKRRGQKKQGGGGEGENGGGEGESGGGGGGADGDADYGEPKKIRRSKDGKPLKKYQRRVAKLKLDDALAVAGKDGQFAGWSEARIRAYKLIEHNPNAYYYRFNAPGEAQRNGPWSKEEKEWFFKRVEEIGVNRQWGIFSMTIPGRVGYQCSNFYRHLIEKGKVKDDNYEIDANGKAHFRFKKGPRRSSADKEPGERRQSAKKRKRASGEDEDSGGGEEDGEYRPPPSRRKKDEDGAEEAEQDSQAAEGNGNNGSKKDNPLPGFIDPITLDEVEQPAISPYGHVMSYSSWSRCLTGTNICPLTKKPLKKRDLVVLTWDNIDQYMENIANWN